MRERFGGRRGPWGLMVVGLGILALSAGRMPAAESSAADGVDGGVVYEMVFPLLGQHTLTDSFGDPRGRNRSHEGVDVLADRMVPVVAVADGVVRWVHSTRGGRCCDVAVLHDDGWRSRYIHLNNDTPGTDDGRAVGIAPGVKEGARVQAGQLIGWVGDSGNAESTVPHLHFELRRPDGTPVDPLPSLKAALRTGRALAPPADPDAGPEAGETRRGGLWRRLLGRGEPRQDDGDGSAIPEPEVGPTPPMPPEEGEPDREDEGDDGRASHGNGTVDGIAPPGLPAEEPVPVAEERAGALPGLGMDRRVEEVPVEAAARKQPSEEPQQASGGWLSCFGFSGEEEGEAAEDGR